MDFCRAAHDEQCKFFNNGGPVIPVRFYEAAADAPTLGLTNIIYPGINDPQFFPDWTIGTPTTPYVNFTGATAPLGLTYNHICGTSDQFARGATFNASTPPIPIGAQLLPLCCAPPPRVGGGAGAGGRASYTVISRPPVTSWGWSIATNVSISGGAGPVITTGGGGFPMYVYLVGHYTPPPPSGWTQLRSGSDPSGTVFYALYFKLAVAPVETFGPNTTGTDRFSYMTLLPNGTGTVQVGSVTSNPSTTSIAPSAVNTLTANTVVASLWIVTAVTAVPGHLPNSGSWGHFTFNDSGVAADVYGSAVLEHTGLPFSPGAATWSTHQTVTTFSDSSF